MQQLRTELDRITGFAPAEQQRIVEKLRAKHSHTIVVANDITVARVPVRKFTCFMYAFGLADSNVVRKISGRLRQVFPGQQFVSFLINNHLQEVTSKEVGGGDVILYLRGEIIAHAGKIADGRVNSKWGNGLLWNHRIAEVPASYGTDVRYYRAISNQEAERAFVEWGTACKRKELIHHLLTVK